MANAAMEICTLGAWWHSDRRKHRGGDNRRKHFTANFQTWKKRTNLEQWAGTKLTTCAGFEKRCLEKLECVTFPLHHPAVMVIWNWRFLWNVESCPPRLPHTSTYPNSQPHPKHNLTLNHNHHSPYSDTLEVSCNICLRGTPTPSHFAWLTCGPLMDKSVSLEKNTVICSRKNSVPPLFISLLFFGRPSRNTHSTSYE